MTAAPSAPPARHAERLDGGAAASAAHLIAHAALISLVGRKAAHDVGAAAAGWDAGRAAAGLAATAAARLTALPVAPALEADVALAKLAAHAEHASGDRKASGSFYTGTDVARYITRSTIVAAVVERCPSIRGSFGLEHALTSNDDLLRHVRRACGGGAGEGIREPSADGGRSAPAAGAARAARAELVEALQRTVVLDPTCGSGAFLVEAAVVLLALWESSGTAPPAGAPWTSLRGVDLSGNAVEACRWSLVVHAAATAGSEAATTLARHVDRLVRAGDAVRGELPRGVDVVVGNPPYVREAVPRTGSLSLLRTASCANRYAWVTEQALSAVRPGGRVGLVVPVSSLCADQFDPYRELWDSCADQVWASSYDAVPCTLFPGTVQRLAILLGRRRAAVGHAGRARWYVTRYHRWRAAERDGLFQQLSYTERPPQHVGGSIAKIGSRLEGGILERMFAHEPAGELLVPRRAATGRNRFWYRRRWSYFLFFADFVPCMLDSQGAARPPSEFKPVDVVEDLDYRVLLALFNSSCFYWYFSVFSDNRNVNARDLAAFPCSRPDAFTSRLLSSLAVELMDSLRVNSEQRTCNYRSVGTIQNQYFFQGRTRPILDRIDAALARHYGFDDDQLRFLLEFEADYRADSSS